MRIIYLIFFLFLVSLLLILNFGKSLTITLQNSTYNIEISNNSIHYFNGSYIISCNEIDEGIINLFGKYHDTIYIKNPYVLLIFYHKLNVSVSNMTFYNNGSNDYLLLYINDSSLKLFSIYVGKYQALNIPGINQTYRIMNSSIEIDINGPLSQVLQFSNNSWTTYQFSNNSSLSIVMGIIPNSIYNQNNVSSVIILNESNNKLFSNNVNNDKYNKIIYYVLLVLSILTLVVALVTTHAKREQ